MAGQDAIGAPSDRENVSEFSTEDYFTNDADAKFGIGTMLPYVSQVQEIDKVLLGVVGPDLRHRPHTILDACCGIGHVARLLVEVGEGHTAVGFDRSPAFVEAARQTYGDIPNLTFEVLDLFDLAERYAGAFDLVVSWKTLCWLPGYEEALRRLVTASRDRIIVSSLFYEGDIDFEIRVTEHAKIRRGMSGHSYYNVYSLPRFTAVAKSLGARFIDVHDFEIGIDLPRPPVDQMGTYTVRLEDGRRAQISGAVLMSWKVIDLRV